MAFTINLYKDGKVKIYILYQQFHKTKASLGRSCAIFNCYQFFKVSIVIQLKISLKKVALYSQILYSYVQRLPSLKDIIS